MQLEPYYSLEITEPVDWNKTNLSLGPVSLCPCLKSQSPSVQTSEYIVLRHNHTWQLLILSQTKTQDLLNMLTTLERVI